MNRLLLLVRYLLTLLGVFTPASAQQAEDAATRPRRRSKAPRHASVLVR